MRIYLDCCCLQRPFDDQTQPRIRVETEAVLAILSAIQSKDMSLLSSEALEYEISKIPDKERRDEAISLLSLSTECLVITEETEALIESFEKIGIGSMDSVHLAIASSSNADLFVTCDDKLFRKSQSVNNLNCKVIPLLDAILETL